MKDDFEFEEDRSKMFRKEEKKFDLDNMNPYSMFLPKSRTALTQDYPELKNYPELKALRGDKLLFCWYLGCEGSPAYEYYTSDSKSEKVTAIHFAKKHSKWRIADYEFENFLNMETLPADIVRGIEIFNTFKLGVRIRMKLMAEKMLENFEKVVYVDVNGPDFNLIDKDGNNTGERDYGKVKQYSDTCINIRNKMNDLLQQVEHGFGVTEKSEESRLEEGQSFIDLKHELNKH